MGTEDELSSQANASQRNQEKIGIKVFCRYITSFQSSFSDA